MKTRNTISMKIAVLAILFATASCTTSENSSKTDGATSTAKTNAAAPELDIHTAVITDNMEALKQHIAAGSNLNERDPFGGSSPLISAAVFNKPEMARLLIDAGADINFQNNDGSTALHTASFFCRPEIVKMLLDKNADKGIRNSFGATAQESVTAPFKDIKNSYDMIGKMLEPMGLKLDYAYIEKTRPEIAAMLK